MKIHLIYESELDNPDIIAVMKKKSLLHLKCTRIVTDGGSVGKELQEEYKAATAEIMKVIEEFEKTAEKKFVNLQWESSNVVTMEEANAIIVPIG